MGGFYKVGFIGEQEVKEALFPGGFSLYLAEIKELGESKDFLVGLLTRGVGYIVPVSQSISPVLKSPPNI